MEKAAGIEPSEGEGIRQKLEHHLDSYKSENNLKSLNFLIALKQILIFLMQLALIQKRLEFSIILKFSIT